MPLTATASVGNLLNASDTFRAFAGKCLARFNTGDWGDVSREDAAMNTAAHKTGARIMASYTIPADCADGADTQLWIIADAADDPLDPRTITLLYPSEY